MSISKEAVIAANRFGLGARPGELQAASRDPATWLARQISRASASPRTMAALPTSAEVGRRFIDFRRKNEEARRNGGAAAPRMFQDTFVPIYKDEVLARILHAITTPDAFAERLVHFWSNHFSVSTQKAQVLPLAGAFEREAIRPNIFGRFNDILSAVVKHPGMLVYLDNIQSIGPNSRVGRRRKSGLNENLAREILELHTLGVDSGYTQADVTAFAKVLTGWTVTLGPKMPGRAGKFVFVSQIHEPGAHTVLGKSYRQRGIAQGEAVLADLSRHPSTARFIATKLARHFVADDPTESAVDRLANSFLETNGDLAAVSRTLIDLPEAWQQPLAKFKTPNEYIVSALRALDVKDPPDNGVFGSLMVMGQPTFAVPSPEGWPDTAAEWTGPDGILRRAEWAVALGEKVGPHVDTSAIAQTALGPVLTDETRLAVQRAASRAQALTLLIASPEFQRR